MKAGKYYLDVVLKSQGMAVHNRLHARSFSVNILRMNAQELAEAIDITEHPQVMTEVFKQENESATDQMHREANRLVHNYVCSVSTFADHSRNFMNLHYKGTEFHEDYLGEVKQVFDEGERSRFVRGLRNFITHRGLPASSIELHMEAIGEPNDEGGVPAAVRASVYYKKERFLDWDGWTAPARRFLDQGPDKLPLRYIFEPHFQTMEKFNEWFEERYREHHKSELEELDLLQERLALLESEEAADARESDE